MAWASLIFIATSVPISGALASDSPPGADKLVHAALYAVLAWLSYRAVGVASARAAIGVLVATTLMGAVDEWHQQFIPGREPATADWIADMIGAGAGMLAFHTARRREAAS